METILKQEQINPTANNHIGLAQKNTNPGNANNCHCARGELLHAREPSQTGNQTLKANHTDTQSVTTFEGRASTLGIAVIIITPHNLLCRVPKN